MLTLDEAITHAEELAAKMMSNCELHACGLEHKQLADWLKELKQYKLKELK